MAFTGSPFSPTVEPAAAAGLGSPPIAGRIALGHVEGVGTYRFPDPSGRGAGTVYVGALRNSQFHGRGTLYFEGGGQYAADWVDGVANQGVYTFQDGLAYRESNWSYCAASGVPPAPDTPRGAAESGQPAAANPAADRAADPASAAKPAEAAGDRRFMTERMRGFAQPVPQRTDADGRRPLPDVVVRALGTV
ncbi:hypothetical protein CXG81DRAFT_10267 [Caulochytrium protostelioides]|uniref:MORN repeat-containing protein 5 n=1 Tax=Caulochytrium protostelioides TaxID=1555241 RepID=A0A4P9XBW2_9FUNG|nr:hypothetical protein CXG81DRAFT_10267 [Caulochytrium protostelioides]|eukprot:RKP02882.1 hypothetical protein CXG81DRAFT_10267 [Caulochytrium protostelioides]